MTASQEFYDLNLSAFGSTVLASNLTSGFASVTVRTLKDAEEVKAFFSKAWNSEPVSITIVEETARANRPAVLETREQYRAWVSQNDYQPTGNYCVLIDKTSE